MNSARRISDRSSLGHFFSPTSVAVLGATDREGSAGRTVVGNLLARNYKGRVYLINPRREELFGRRCYAAIEMMPEAVDLVVVVTPVETAPRPNIHKIFHHNDGQDLPNGYSRRPPRSVEVSAGQWTLMSRSNLANQKERMGLRDICRGQ